MTELEACKVLSLGLGHPVGTCYTNAGAAPNTACVKGVWKYQGLPYEGCANPSAQPLGLWCPTEVTANGDYISGKWGACDMALDACNG